jgi:hypothetical protein
MSYVKQTWADGEAGGTPLTAARLNHMEDGIPTDPEDVRDIIGTTVVGTGLVSVTVDDASDTVTVATSATQNSTDASLRDRATHTGTQSLDTTTDSATRLAMTSTERTKLTGVASGATANATDAQLRDRSTHTGTQTASTISDLTERVQDEVGATLVAGTNMTVAYNDTTGKTTLGSTGISQATADAAYLPKTISGNAMAGVFVVANGATAPGTLPDGTVIVELDA